LNSVESPKQAQNHDVNSFAEFVEVVKERSRPQKIEQEPEKIKPKWNGSTLTTTPESLRPQALDPVSSIQHSSTKQGIDLTEDW